MNRSETDEEILDTFFEGETRADSWRALRETLQVRLRDAVTERDALPDGDPRRAALGRRIAEMRRQVEALLQEETVSRFVEDSIRATLARPTALRDTPEEEAGPS